MAARSVRAVAGHRRRSIAAALAGVLAAALLLGGCQASAPAPLRNGAGAVLKGGVANWSSLEVGDCVSDDLTTSGAVAPQASVVLCASGQARAQLVATSSSKAWSHTKPSSTSSDGLSQWCQQAFATFVGIAANKSSFGMNLVSVQNDNSSVQCFALSTGTLTGSLKGVKK